MKLSSCFLLCILLSSALFISPSIARGTVFGDLFGKIIGNNLKANEGNDCVGCTVVMAILEQLVQLQNQTIDNVLSGVCKLFPAGDFRDACDGLVLVYGPTVIKLIENDENPDEVCLSLGICKNDTCHLFPQKQRSRPLVRIEIPRDLKFKLPAFAWPWTQVADHLPAVDADGDKFGVLPTLRGTHWRGKDCDDGHKDVYPGRQVSDYDASIDHNCNGISGSDPKSGNSYEYELCSGTEQYGYVILGDSAGAHFHVPPQWVTPSQYNNNTFANVLEILEDELDWPDQSSATGFMNSTYSGKPEGPVDSMYLRLRNRNYCMHRDYQNIAVNGARSSSMNRSIVGTMARDQRMDQPVFATYALIGNDVCNGHFGMSHMTTPQEFYENVVAVVQYLDTQLPIGSHLSIMGLVDGRVLYDSMHARIHPIGQLNQDVTYSAFYDYLNCLQISPCFGWMNSDEYWRNETTMRAFELNDVYKQVVANNTFKNFDMIYFDCPLNQVLDEWVAQGGEAWQIIEPVDGFHPDQVANALLTEAIWANLVANHSSLLPPINPNNAKISQIFGDQGGY